MCNPTNLFFEVFPLIKENNKLTTLLALGQLAQMVNEITGQILLKTNITTERIIIDDYLLTWINSLPNDTIIIPLSHEILADERNNILVSWNGLYQMQGIDFIITHLEDGYDYSRKIWSGYIADGIQFMNGNKIKKGDKFIVQYCFNPISTPTKVTH